MSLWTPDGERRVDPTSPTPMGADLEGSEDLDGREDEAREIAAEMQRVREQLAEVPAAVVVANHAMGCYELAAIHLSSQPPKLSEAQLAIDAFAALLQAVRGRLGDDEATLDDALAQIRLAYVQVSGSLDQSDGGSPEP